MEALLQILAVLLPILVEAVRTWDERRMGGDYDTNIQQYRKALAQNNAARRAALHADQHDRVQHALRVR